MNRFLLEGGASAGSIAIYVVLIVMLVLMLVLPYFSNRKKSKEFQSMIDALKVGDMVRTAGGVIGRIVRISDKGEIKTVLLETGSKTEKSYMEFDLSMIYCVLKSSKAETEETEAKKGEAKATTETKVEKSETKAEEVETKAAEPEKVEETNATEKAEAPAKRKKKPATTTSKNSK